MEIKVGDRVVVYWKDIYKHPDLDAVCYAGLFWKLNGVDCGDYVKTEVVKINTHKFLGLIKRKTPMYELEFHACSDKVKLIVRG